MVVANLVPTGTINRQLVVAGAFRSVPQIGKRGHNRPVLIADALTHRVDAPDPADGAQPEVFAPSLANPALSNCDPARSPGRVTLPDATKDARGNVCRKQMWARCQTHSCSPSCAKPRPKTG